MVRTALTRDLGARAAAFVANPHRLVAPRGAPVASGPLAPQETSMPPIRLAVAAALCCLPALARAQREQPTFDWQKRTTTIDYGAAIVGKRTIADLPMGQQWHLGMGEASLWSSTMPILAGDTVMAPGTYRIHISRTGEVQCTIVAQGTQHALGGGSELRVPGDVTKNGKPSKKLTIDWSKAGPAAGGNQPLQIVLQFGEILWKGDVTAVGHKAASVPGYKLAVFTLPANVVAARDRTPVPVASVARGGGKEPECWNIVVGGSGSRLVPWMQATFERNADAKRPDEARTTTGTVSVAPAQVEQPLEVLELREASLAKGAFDLKLAFGTETLHVVVPEPKKK
jgi:hypothetical protein